MKKRALAAFAAASAASLALLMAAPAPAVAATDISGPHYWMYTNDDNPGGRIDFWPNGDVFELCDTQADGYGVYAEVNAYTSSAYALSVGGNGTCVIGRASQGGVRDLPEEACITVVIWLNKTSTGTPAFSDSAAWLNDNDIKTNC